MGHSQWWNLDLLLAFSALLLAQAIHQSLPPLIQAKLSGRLGDEFCEAEKLDAVFQRKIVPLVFPLDCEQTAQQEIVFLVVAGEENIGFSE